jgi:hypothetical protein
MNKFPYPISKRTFMNEFYRARIQSRSSTNFSKFYWDGYLLALSKAMKGISLSKDTIMKNLLLLEHSPNIHKQQKAIGAREAFSFCMVKRNPGRQPIGTYTVDKIHVSEEIYNGLTKVQNSSPHKSMGDIRREFLKLGIATELAELKQLQSEDLSS